MQQRAGARGYTLIEVLIVIVILSILAAIAIPMYLGRRDRVADWLPASPLRRRLQELRAVVAHGLDDVWVAPDPALTDWRSILGDYGQAFDGYRLCEGPRPRVL